MRNLDTLAIRIEWLDSGPFWCEKTRKLLTRLCRQATPDWKTAVASSPTFLDHYIQAAPCPYHHARFDWHLSRQPETGGTLAFGFTSGAVLRDLFGLSNELYRRQFQHLLERSEFAVRAFFVHPLAVAPHEVLYRRSECELVDEVRDWDALLAL